MDFSKPLAVDIRVRNGIMVQAISETGKSIMQIHRETGIALNSVYGLVNMKVSPLNQENEWTKAASVLAAYLGYSPEELFPENTWAPLVENKKTLFGNFNRTQIARRTATASLLYSGDLSSCMEGIMDCLKPQERRIVEKRFGLGGKPPQTLDEIGREDGCSKERIRYIEHRALNKIRSYRLNKAYELKGVVEDLDQEREFCKVVDVECGAEEEDGNGCH